jgi:hypothetical protein
MFIVILFGVLSIIFITSKSAQKRLLTAFRMPVSTATIIPSLNRSKWEVNKLVVIPAIWKEIDWANHSSWPFWLRQGLASQSYHVHLYQRIDPNSTAPYDWPYCPNIHEEAGVYLQFIYDYYHDLPNKMLFIHGNPYAHSSHPIEAAQCIRDDVHYANINNNNLWIKDRAWSVWARDQNDSIAMMYKCAKHLLTLFGFDGEAQLNPNNIIPKDNNTISTFCCAQFFVTKERIHHYTYEQWSSVYHELFKPYCASEYAVEIPGEPDIKWFGGSFEHLWHVILGLHSTNMPSPRYKEILIDVIYFVPLVKDLHALMKQYFDFNSGYLLS